MTEVTDRTRVAGKAYVSVFEDPEWGLKASEEDAMLAVIEALYPDFPKGADGIYAIRDNEKLNALCTEMWEGPVSDGNLDEYGIAEWLVPRLDAILGAPKTGLTQDQQKALDFTIGKATNENLERAVGVHFKSEWEDEGDGTASGPVFLMIPKGDEGYNPAENTFVPVREGGDAQWFTETYAERLAEALGVPLWSL